MKRKELIRCVVDLLRDSNVKKSVHVPKHTLHISDNDGNSKDFTVKSADKEVAFTSGDVGAIIDAAIRVIIDALIRGDNITIHGFGSLGLQYRKQRSTKKIGTNEDIVIAGRYVPKFVFGNELRMAARLYEMSATDRLECSDAVDFDDEFEDYDFDMDVEQEDGSAVI